MSKNWDRRAMRFAVANYVPRQSILDVTFQNGDHFLVAVESLLGVRSQAELGNEGTPLEWANLRIGETGDVLEVPALDAVIEIPWDRIRAIADPDVRAHLADCSDERARRIGGRIRTMRLQAKLTRLELAAKVGVAQEMVASLETGKIEPPLDLIEHLALALGKRLQDFAEA